MSNCSKGLATQTNIEAGPCTHTECHTLSYMNFHLKSFSALGPFSFVVGGDAPTSLTI